MEEDAARKQALEEEAAKKQALEEEARMAEAARVKKIKEEAVIQSVEVIHKGSEAEGLGDLMTVLVILEDHSLLLELNLFNLSGNSHDSMSLQYGKSEYKKWNTSRVPLEC